MFNVAAIANGNDVAADVGTDHDSDDPVAFVNADAIDHASHYADARDGDVDGVNATDTALAAANAADCLSIADASDYAVDHVTANATADDNANAYADAP